MSIKKLGLTSTIAILSVTSVLGGCNLFKTEEQIEQIKAKAVAKKAKAVAEAEYWKALTQELQKNAQLAEELAEEEAIKKSILKDIEATKRLGDMKNAMVPSVIPMKNKNLTN